MQIVRFIVNGESGEWSIPTLDSMDRIIADICDEYGVQDNSVEIISIEDH